MPCPLSRQYDICIRALERIDRAGDRQDLDDVLGIVRAALARVDRIEAEHEADAGRRVEQDEPADILSMALMLAGDDQIHLQTAE